MRLETWSRAAAVLGMIGITSAFNFNTSETPSECGDYTVEWEGKSHYVDVLNLSPPIPLPSGGQEPFSVVVVPVSRSRAAQTFALTNTIASLGLRYPTKSFNTFLFH